MYIYIYIIKKLDKYLTITSPVVSSKTQKGPLVSHDLQDEEHEETQLGQILQKSTS